MTHSLSRRALMRGAATATLALACGAFGGAQAQALAAPSLDSFMALSARITASTSLDKDMGQQILDALIATGQGDALGSIAAQPAPQDDRTALANELVAAWYSGLSPSPGATEVTGFNSALVWTALTYTKPWGNCGGETGYWGDPPADPVP
jgi:hypothetical protein